MSPSSDDLDDEIRGHLALSIKERIERGEDPAAARLAAIKEFGNLTLTRDSMHGVWRHRWFNAAEALGRDIRFALRALSRSKASPRPSSSRSPSASAPTRRFSASSAASCSARW